MNMLALAIIALTIALETVQQLAFKVASLPSQTRSGKTHWTAVAVSLHVPHLAAWFYVLKLLPLSIATPMLGAAYVTVPLASQIIFKEKVDRRRWLGIAAIISGLILVGGAMG